MTPHLYDRLKWIVGFFALGCVTDVLVVVWYRSVSSGLIPLAMAVSFLVTLVPFLVTWKGVEARRPELFFAYALGASVGTLLGMLVRLG